VSAPAPSPRRDGARLAVPGPVWGERPARALPQDPGGRAPPRGPTWTRLLPGRDRGPEAIDPEAVLARAGRIGARPARDPLRRRRRAVAAVVRALVARGLACGPTGQALALAGATLAATTGLVPRANQYRSAALLLAQRLVELDTGEGKSVAVALAAGVAALAGAPVHVLTANGYLARRDAHAFAPYYAALGVSVDAVAEEDDAPRRRGAWRADVAYAASRTLGFDWLRDATAAPDAPPLLRGLCVAIVDEADAVLLDEARTPLVLAEQADDPVGRARAWRALDVARRLEPGADLAIGRAGAPVRLTPRGAAAIERQVPGGDLGAARERDAWVEEAATALHALRRDVDYLVDATKGIVLVDRSTGRGTPGRHLSRHLHLLVALKEGLRAPPAMRVAASVTYPDLLARYHHVCGTSGTLAEAARELRRDYGLRTVRVASHRPSRLRHGPMRVFADRDALFGAAVRRAGALAAGGRPVLVGVDSVDDASALADAFARAGVPATLLDARHDADEAERVAAAGRAGRVTVTTQRAGRGTDIGLERAALDAGGLHVLNLQHNRSARIDRQLVGRSARRGEPGSTEHWLRPDADALRGLAPAAWLARRLAAPRGDDGAGAALRHRLAALLWRGCQAWWRLEDAAMRGDALRADRDRSRRLDVAARANRNRAPRLEGMGSG